jgi:UDP-N-acetylmuramate: L-alanyl-gamma-D-glutamyl-meso-diaminopimelate ligase
VFSIPFLVSSVHFSWCFIAMLTGIAWDHINVFPAFEGYVDQFRIFAEMIEPGGALIYFEGDEHLCRIAKEVSGKTNVFPYNTHPFVIESNETKLIDGEKKIPLLVFGDHNLQNIAGAKLVCEQLGLTSGEIYDAIAVFGGSSRRLEIVAQNNDTTIFYDFAHSTSKLKATTLAVKKQFADRKLVAVMELQKRHQGIWQVDTQQIINTRTSFCDCPNGFDF